MNETRQRIFSRPDYPRLPVIVVLVSISLAMAGCAVSTSERRVPLDPPRLEESSAVAEERRFRRILAETLVQDNILLNKTRDEVIELIGEPDGISPGSDEYDEILHYDLGREYSSTILGISILIDDGVVSDVEITVE